MKSKKLVFGVGFNDADYAVVKRETIGCADGKQKRRRVWCCACNRDVDARLTDGSEIYPHRKDLESLPFWMCDECTNFVGCHHKTKNRTAPLGCIPSPEIKEARKHIHALIDPIWQSGKMRRKDLYAEISERIGWAYHTAEIRSVEEAREVYRIVRLLAAEQAIGAIGGGV